MELEDDDILSLSFEDLVTFTDDFSESNYVGYFQFGEFYRGKIVSDEKTRHVMVKIWEVPEIYNYVPGDNEGRLMDEVNLHRHELVINRPGLSSLYGYCLENGYIGVVYDFNPLDTVCNLVPKDDFTWLQRIKVALALAHLLKFLHTRKCSYYKSFIVRNLDCAHLVLDEDYNLKLCDFGMITGGIFPDRTIFKHHHVNGSYGYIDISSCYAGDYSDKKDVYAFGTILLSLISKKVYNKDEEKEMLVSSWAWGIYKKHVLGDPVLDLDENYKGSWDMVRVLYENPESKPPKFSLVHQSLAAEPDYNIGDGLAITRLAYKCIDVGRDERPTMNQVFKKMLRLKAVKQNADFLGLNKLMRACQDPGRIVGIEEFVCK